MGDLKNLFNFQMSFVTLNKFENEFETIRHLYELPIKLQELHNQMTLEWLNNLKNQGIVNRPKNKLLKESKQYREDGNKVFLAKTKESNTLIACRLYTKAILVAPPNSEELALAYANRGVALQDFGYYQQAYDDCECALEFGYPDRLLHKLLTRQAVCALKMKNIIKLKLHLDSLCELELSDRFQSQLKELKLNLEALQHQPQQVITKKANFAFPMNRDAQAIIDSKKIKGRYMIAAKDFKKNDLIFHERAPSFVPVADSLICQQCAATLIVPIPCAFCYGQVVYCSLNCQLEHAHIHKYECEAYQQQLFNHVGIAHLALRMMLDGFTQIIPLLKEKHDAKELWAEVTDSGCIIQSKTIEYAETLSMITHLNQMSLKDIIWFALVSKLLVVYLKNYTSFFDLINDSKCNNHEWEVFTASMILRHIGQLIVNGHSCISIIPKFDIQQDSQFFPLFSSELWCNPLHLKKGLLHKFSEHDKVAAANFPYLSICNHSCEQSFQPKFSGRYVTTFASKPIKTNEEICNCYSLDYRKSMYCTRKVSLQYTYHFQCKCEKCKRPKPDEDYERFHRYRCENSSCREIFVPHLPALESLNWWSSENGFSPEDYIRCTICNAKQRCNWLNQFLSLLDQTNSVSCRSILFDKFAELDTWLLDYHELKLFLAFSLVRNCFNSHKDGSYLTNTEFEKVVDILKFCLRGAAKQSYINSIEYVVKMTYMWDIIAMGKYKCTQMKFREMLNAIEIVSDEIKMIFMNYYTDYIKDFLCL